VPGLEDFVELIGTKVAAIHRDQVVAREMHGALTPRDPMEALGVGELSESLASFLGADRVSAFYERFEPTGATGSFHLFLPLWLYLSESIENADGGSFTLNREILLTRLSELEEAVRAGACDYSVSLRFANIDILEDFDLAPGIRFRKLSKEEVASKYPIERRYTAVPEMVEEHWPKHRVEAQIARHGTPADIQSLSLKSLDAIVHSLLSPFLLANITPSLPAVTHVVIQSVLGGSCQHQWSGGGFAFEPHVLTARETATLRDIYSFLTEDVSEDRVIETAVDRFLIGKKRNTHHPNRINEPNWDKIVDYVIAMETLFLTVNGQPINDELSYRFSLNGSSLLERAVGGNVRAIFHALKSLYGLRSAVVHGGTESAILRTANKFIEHLEADQPDHQHSLGRLLVICRQVEDWILKTFLYLRVVPSTERPFRKKDGWEELLWQKRD
jgi:hypothetical protein